MEAAKPILQEHRGYGYKQILLDIINILLSPLAWAITGQWRLFHADTASMQAVNKITEDLESSASSTFNPHSPKKL